MRPNITLWSDYRSPKQTHWRSPYRRRTRSSIGPKILLVAVAFVAVIVGISGIYPQIIDSEWVQNAGIHAKRTAGEPTKTRRSGLVTAIPLSPRPTVTTGEAAASAPPAAPPAAPARAAAEPPKGRSSVAAVELPRNEAAPPPADILDAQAMADPPAQAVADPPAKPAAATPVMIRPAQRYVARAPVVVKKRVARTEHRRSNSGAYAQYGTSWGGGWGWPGMGSPYHF
jgi:hypothetical protein